MNNGEFGSAFDNPNELDFVPSGESQDVNATLEFIGSVAEVFLPEDVNIEFGLLSQID